MGINVNIYNIILFNLGWAACVLGGNTAAVLAVCVVTWLHLQYVSGNANEWVLLLAVSCFGVLLDGFLFWAGLLVRPEHVTGTLTGLLPPLWMICLWWIFATTLGHSLQWFNNKKIICVLAGAIAGPFAYISGAGLSNVTMADGLLPLLALSTAWAVFLPIAIGGANQFQRRYGFA